MHISSCAHLHTSHKLQGAKPARLHSPTYLHPKFAAVSIALMAHKVEAAFKAFFYLCNFASHKQIAFSVVQQENEHRSV